MSGDLDVPSRSYGAYIPPPTPDSVLLGGRADQRAQYPAQGLAEKLPGGSSEVDQKDRTTDDSCESQAGATRASHDGLHMLRGGRCPRAKDVTTRQRLGPPTNHVHTCAARARAPRRAGHRRAPRPVTGFIGGGGVS